MLHGACPFPENGNLSMLINDVSKLFDNQIRRETERFGMASGYRRLLFHLARGDCLTQQELVRRTHLTAPTVSVTLQKMEADGLVDRRTDEQDMRQTLVSLTDKGRRLDQAVRDKLEETERLMTGELSEDDRRLLKDLLLRVRGSLIAAGALPREREENA